MGTSYLLFPLKNRRNRHSARRGQGAGRPRRDTVTLGLEPLEERWLPSAATPAPPPSFYQAATNLFFDGVQLIGERDTGNTAFGQVFFGNSQGIAGVNASIAANSPYVGPFAPFLVMAGEIYEYENLSIGRLQAESF